MHPNFSSSRTPSTVRNGALTLLCAFTLAACQKDAGGEPDLSDDVKSDDLAEVATSGDYGDLSGSPDLSGFAEASALAPVATSGAFQDLTGNRSQEPWSGRMVE